MTITHGIAVNSSSAMLRMACGLLANDLPDHHLQIGPSQIDSITCGRCYAALTGREMPVTELPRSPGHGRLNAYSLNFYTDRNGGIRASATRPNGKRTRGVVLSDASLRQLEHLTGVVLAGHARGLVEAFELADEITEAP